MYFYPEFWWNYTIRIQFLIILAYYFCSIRIRSTYCFLRTIIRIYFFFFSVCSIEHGSEKTSFYRALIYNYGVFLIISCKTSNSYSCIYSKWNFFSCNKLQWFIWGQRYLGIIKCMKHCIKSNIEICRIKSHWLFSL